MSFIEGLKTLVTGKNKQEREEDAKYISEARREIQKATLEARKENALRLAKEKERLKADAQLKRLNESYSKSNSGRTLIFGAVKDNGDTQEFNLLKRTIPLKNEDIKEFKVI